MSQKMVKKKKKANLFNERHVSAIKRTSVKKEKNMKKESTAL